jgi:hypothetical protein
MATEQEIQLQSALNELIKDQRDLIREINNELKGGINYTKEVRKQYSALESISDTLNDDAEALVELTEKQLEKERFRATKALERLKYAAQELNKNKEQILSKRKLTDQENILLAALENQFKFEDELLKTVNARIDSQKNLNKAVGLTGTLLKGSAGLMEKLGFSGTIVEESLKKAKEAAYDKAKALQESGKNMDTLSVKTQTMTAGIKSLGTSMLKAFKDPLVILGLTVALYKKLFDLTKEHDELLTKTGRQLAINKEQVQGMYENYYKYAATANDAFVTGQRLLESQLALNEALGTQVDYGAQSAESFARLTHFYGLSAEQAGKLEELGREQGKNSTEILNSTIKTAAQQKLQFGGAISYQNVLKKVSGVSGEILTKFKGNTEALVQAIMQADRLGLSLEQVDKVGESLLNFESSIESELKAELLTGKAINLEKARSAALSGDTAALTQEIVKQVGNIHQFEKMNVIQRKAYAEAFGMSANEMGDMLRKQEFEAKLGEKAKASAEEQLKYAKEHGIAMSDAIQQQLEQRSLAEEQKEIFDKLRDILRRITSGPMLSFFHLIEKALHGVTKIIEGFGKITGGGLGNALGAALIGLPAAIGIFRLGASLFMPKPTGRPTDPIATYQVGGPGMGAMGGANGTFYKGGQFIPGGGRAPAGGVTIPPAGASNRAIGGGFFGTPKAMGVGIGLGIGGMALSSAASNMEPGGAKTAVGVLGGAAAGAGMGMMFGPWGAAIGGLIGGVGALVSGLEADREAEKANREKEAEAAKQSRELIENLSVRPIQLGMNADTLQKWSTAQQNGANPAYS